MLARLIAEHAGGSILLFGVAGLDVNGNNSLVAEESHIEPMASLKETFGNAVNATTRFF